MRNFASPSLSRILYLGIVLLGSCLLATCEGFSEDDVVQTRSAWCPSAFFNFGDSLSDTGNTQLVMPGLFLFDTLPYGETFFQQSSGRASNGRLVIDFILMAFKMRPLSPSASLSHEKDLQGLNFAYAGATAGPRSWHVPYPLDCQIGQFRKLKDQVLQKQPEQGLALKDLDQGTHSNALYTICIGGNDFSAAIAQGLQPKAIMQDTVPDVLNAIVSGIEALYSQGARNFMVFNGPPLGCSTSVLGTLEDSGLPLDDLGCITAINEINQALNSKLFRSIEGLRESLPNVTIIHFDYYAANVEILSNPSNYGFNPDLVHTTCCGVPGAKVNTCAMENFQVCDNPDEYMVWDMIHWTEAFYRHIAKFVLNGEFSDPPINLTKICDLSFEAFGSTTYEEVYHRSISLSFDK